MTNSILDTVKKLLGVDADYEAFDTDIIVHINSAFATLHQLGIGPDSVYAISDDEDKWSDFSSDNGNNPIRTYIYMKVRLAFDPPATSYGIKAFEEMCKEIEWRLNVRSENATPIP